MDDDGPAGAEAAAVYFVMLDAYTQATGDTTEWAEMSHSSCEFCTRRIDQAKRITQQGDSFEGGEATVDVVHTYAQDPATGIWPVDLKIRERRTVITDSRGTVVFENEANSHQTTVEIGRRDGRGMVVEVGAADK
jgi:hypothetical protein